MSAFIENFKEALFSRVAAMFWAVLALFLTLTGPFGAYATFVFTDRLLICCSIVLIAALVSTVIRTAIFSAMAAYPFRITAIVNAVVVTAVLAPPLLFLIQYLAQIYNAEPPNLDELVLLIGSMSLALSSLRRIAAVKAAADIEAELPEEPAKKAEHAVRLMQRIEPDLRGELYAISVRDHYVDVQTSQGSSSILLRLGDAMIEAEPVDGAQVHRSHWVAWSAVDGVERDGIKLFLRLKHGGRVPVSKNHREKLEERGLVERRAEIIQAAE